MATEQLKPLTPGELVPEVLREIEEKEKQIYDVLKAFHWRPGDPAGPWILKQLAEADQLALAKAALERSNRVLTAYQTAINAHVELNKHVQTALSKAKLAG